MAQSNQSPGSLRGVTPLAYAGSTPNMVFNTRRPTARDVFNFELGTWWIIPKKKSGASASDPTREVWILVGNARQTANWKKLHGGAGPTEDSSVKVTVLSTPGSGTFTFDPSMHQVQVECVGGGGGASGARSVVPPNVAASSGGGSGGYVKKLFNSSTVGASQSYVVGSGGLSGVSGTNTTFGSFLVGGGGNTSADEMNFPVIGGNGGIATGGDINIPGSQGGTSSAFHPAGGETAVSGVGGSNMYGSGGQGVVIGSNDGNPGIGYGSGGGGACNFGGAPTLGGNGANGVIIITEYLS